MSKHSCSLLALLLCAACSTQRMAEIAPVDLGPAPTEGPPAADVPRESTMGDKLAAAGLDLADLPALEEVDRSHLLEVMQIFTASLGASCDDCHTRNRREETANKRIARKMWSEMVQKLSLADGQPLFCDSCHKGKLKFLQRDDETQLASYMKTAFVEGLKRRDGAEHGCFTCHGDPFDGSFLDRWADGEDAN